MEIFLLVLQQMLMMVTLILAGFFLRKKNIVPENTGIILSKLETYIFLPALNIINQLNNCNVENFVNNSGLMLYGLVLILLAVLLSYPLSKLFVRNSNESDKLMYKRNIYKYALTFGNYGFIGNFLILGIWGDAVFYQYTMLCFFAAIICNSWGLYVLIPKDSRDGSMLKNLKKGLITPPIIALLFGIICGLLNLKQYFPNFVLSALDNSSKCMGPIAMILAGMIIGGYDVKTLFSDKKIYAISFLRLIAIPAVFMLLLKALGTPKEIMTLVLILFATPMGMNTIVFPAAYGGETKTGASMLVVSSIFAVITIPIMYYVFIVLL